MVVLRVQSVVGFGTGAAHVGSGADAERIVGALADVADIAVLPNGTVLVAEDSGRIIAASPGKTSATAFDLRTLDRSTTEVQLLALAVAPDFDDSHAVFAVYVTQRGLRLARFTEAHGVLTNHAILREGLPVAISSPAAALAVGPDNKIYLATTGQVLRLNMDGSTPADGSDSGLFSAGVQQPEKLSWSNDQRVLWLLGSTPQGGSVINAIALDDRGQGTALSSYDLGGLNVTSLAVVRDSPRESRLIVTSRSSGDLLEWRVSVGVLDQATWRKANVPEDPTAMGTRNGELWIAARSGLFRIDVSRR